MPLWTKEQLSAIEETEKGVVVSAAAGSGKTAVLIERTVRMLSDEKLNISADRLLAVTFTNAAAAQMKQKLSEELQKALDKRPENSWLVSQQRNLQFAKINTINAFCFDLVRRNIHMFDFESNLRILSENEQEIIFNEAMDETLEYYYQNKPRETDSLRRAFCGENDKALCDMVLSLSRFFDSIPFKELWKSKTLSAFESEEQIKRYTEYIRSDIKSVLTRALKLNALALKKAEPLCINKSVPEVLLSDREALDRLYSYACGEWDELVRELKNTAFKRFSSVIPKSASKNFSDDEISREKLLLSRIKQLRDDGITPVKNLIKTYFPDTDQIKRDNAAQSELFSLLFDFEEAFDNRVYEKMLEKNAVRFSDLEHMTVSLLLEADEDGLKRTPLCEDIVKNEEYKIILIDEFQDVNDLQDIIFKALSNTGDLSVMGSNVFVVGDVKQSIYCFRQSNPGLFIDARKKARSDGTNPLREIVLTKNFRSRSDVIDFVNFIFENLMSENVGEVDYEGDEVLRAGALFADKNDCSTEILIIDDNEEETKYIPYGSEHAGVAKRIRGLIDSGAEVFDEAAGGFRKCRQSDFCVISRNNDSSSKVSKALETEGLSASVEIQSGYLKSREISVIFNLLRIIDNPMQDIPLMSVMMSPVFMFDENEVSLIRLCGRSLKVFQNLLKYAESGENAGLRKKCEDTVDFINRLRFYSAGTTLVRLIRKIYDLTDYYAIASTYDDAHQKRSNLKLFLEYASEYDENIGGGLSGFIRYIDSVISGGRDFKQAAAGSASPDAVNVYTMHGSKGLEFPFVFLCDIFKEFNLADNKKRLLLGRENEAAVKFNDVKTHLASEPLNYMVMSREIENSSKSEELRLLYVAMTRAKEKLFIPVCFNKKSIAKIKSAADSVLQEGITEDFIKGARSFGEWITACLVLHPGASDLRGHIEKLCGISSDYPLLGTSANISVLFSIKSGAQAQANSFLKASPDLNTVESVRERLLFSYDKTKEDSLAKVSVSDIAKDDKRQYFYPQIPKLSEEIGKLTAAEKGTITHTFMEVCDFKRAKENINEEALRLAADGFITAYQLEGIDFESISAFLNSDIYRRMEKSVRIMRETPFLIKMSDTGLDAGGFSALSPDGMIQGIADCMFEEADGFVLIDYKTDKNRTPGELSEDYSAQLRLYKAAFDKILDKPVKECYIYSFDLKEAIPIKF